MTSDSDLEPKYPSKDPLDESNYKAEYIDNNVTHLGSLWATLLVLVGSYLIRLSRRHLLQCHHISVFLTLLLLSNRIELECHQPHKTFKYPAGGQQRPNNIGYRKVTTTRNSGLCYKLCSSLLHAICRLHSSCQQRMVFLWWQDVYS